MVHLENEKRFGIYHTRHKRFMFGICELTEAQAYKKLYDKIGKDSYKWRWEVRRIRLNHIKEGLINIKNIK